MGLVDRSDGGYHSHPIGYLGVRGDVPGVLGGDLPSPRGRGCVASVSGDGFGAVRTAHRGMPMSFMVSGDVYICVCM